MASYYKGLIEHLKAIGCTFVRQGNGSHEIWYSPITNKNFPIPSGNHCQNRLTVIGICKQAGAKKPDWL